MTGTPLSLRYGTVPCPPKASPGLARKAMTFFSSTICWAIARCRAGSPLVSAWNRTIGRPPRPPRSFINLTQMRTLSAIGLRLWPIGPDRTPMEAILIGSPDAPGTGAAGLAGLPGVGAPGVAVTGLAPPARPDPNAGAPVVAPAPVGDVERFGFELRAAGWVVLVGIAADAPDEWGAAPSVHSSVTLGLPVAAVPSALAGVADSVSAPLGAIFADSTLVPQPTPVSRAAATTAIFGIRVMATCKTGPERPPSRDGRTGRTPWPPDSATWWRWGGSTPSPGSGRRGPSGRGTLPSGTAFRPAPAGATTYPDRRAASQPGREPGSGHGRPGGAGPSRRQWRRR